MVKFSQTDSIQPEDDALLEAMLKGSEPAFLALYRRRQAGLYRFALRMTGSHAAAEDAVQETFLELLRRAAKYDPARGSVSAFLYGIARNCVLRGWARNGDLLAVSEAELEAHLERRCRGMAGDSLRHAAPGPDAALSLAEEVDALRRAILALPENYRAVVVLCDLEELSYEEAAAALVCALGTVRSRLHRARAMLGERLRYLTAEVAEGTRRRESGLGGQAIRPLECEA